jgi:hypothetical protein
VRRQLDGVDAREEATDQVAGRSAALALVQLVGEDVLRQQFDVLGEHGDQALEDEAAVGQVGDRDAAHPG